MSAQVIPIASASRVQEAWDEHCYFARRLIAEPKLLTDLQFMQSATRAHDRWRTLFLMGERGK